MKTENTIPYQYGVILVVVNFLIRLSCPLPVKCALDATKTVTLFFDI